MNELILYSVSRCLRAVLYNHAALFFMFYLLYRACGLNRPRWRVIILTVELRMAISTWIIEVMGVFWGQESWYPLLMELISPIYTILIIYLLRYFSGSLGKTLFATIWAETFSMGCIMGAWTMAYWGTGETYMLTSQPLHPRDGLMLLFYLPLCFLCTAALTPILRFYRNYCFRYPRLLLGLDFAIVIRRIYINICSALPKGTYQVTTDLLICNTAAILLVIVLMKKARLKKQIYAEQQRSIEAHFGLLREQAAWVADSRSHLEERIAVIESLHHGKQAEQAASYLTELKAQYNVVLEKTRCKDPLVDALLYYKETLCRQQDITAKFSLQQYGRGSLEEQEIIILLLVLFDGAIQSCQKAEAPRYIALSMALLKGQFFLELSYSGTQKLTKEGIRSILKRHDGMFSQTRTNDGWRTEILLTANSFSEKDCYPEALP